MLVFLSISTQHSRLVKFSTSSSHSCRKCCFGNTGQFFAAFFFFSARHYYREEWEKREGSNFHVISASSNQLSPSITRWGVSWCTFLSGIVNSPSLPSDLTLSWVHDRFMAAREGVRGWSQEIYSRQVMAPWEASASMGGRRGGGGEPTGK